SVPLPSYQTPGSAGLDLCAALPEAVRIQPGERRLIPTGLCLEIPPGFEGQVRARAGLALKYRISTGNSPATISADFRREGRIVLINHGQEPFVVEPLSRIAQLVIARFERVQIEEADSLSDTSRGAGGYGSTGQ